MRAEESSDYWKETNKISINNHSSEEFEIESMFSIDSLIK